MTRVIGDFLMSKTGKWPYWLVYWPICIKKSVFATHTPYQAKRLLRRCHIDARGSTLIWLFWNQCWIYVPRRQAQRAEATLKHYGYKIGGRNLYG